MACRPDRAVSSSVMLIAPASFRSSVSARAARTISPGMRALRMACGRLGKAGAGMPRAVPSPRQSPPRAGPVVLANLPSRRRCARRSWRHRARPAGASGAAAFDQRRAVARQLGLALRHRGRFGQWRPEPAERAPCRSPAPPAAGTGWRRGTAGGRPGSAGWRLAQARTGSDRTPPARSCPLHRRFDQRHRQPGAGFIGQAVIVGQIGFDHHQHRPQASAVDGHRPRPCPPAVSPSLSIAERFEADRLCRECQHRLRRFAVGQVAGTPMPSSPAWPQLTGRALCPAAQNRRTRWDWCGLPMNTQPVSAFTPAWRAIGIAAIWAASPWSGRHIAASSRSGVHFCRIGKMRRGQHQQRVIAIARRIARQLRHHGRCLRAAAPVRHSR